MSDTTAVVDIRDVRKTYIMGKTKVHALQGIGVNVCAGEMVAIMGASGSGKSTLMNIIGGLDYPTSGSYFLDGIEANKLGKNELADIRNAKIGFVFQGFNLLARTSALENVELPLLYDRTGRIKNHKKAALESLNLVGLGDRVDHHPNELSGGQQQRVAIARALVTNPSLVLADEPTGNLDHKNANLIFDSFLELADEFKTAIVLVTHDLSLAKKMKKNYLLASGKLKSN